MAQTRYRHNGAGLCLIQGLKFGPGIQPELIGLFLPESIALSAGKNILDPQCAAGELQVR